METLSKFVEIFNNSTKTFNISLPFALELTHLEALANLISRQNSIIEVTITGQNLDAAKLKSLCSVIQAKVSLKKLILSNNNISDPEGLKHICAGVKISQIEHIDLSRNRIGDECIGIIADMIENSRLASVVLDDNCIVKGPLPQAVCKSERLQCLSINQNPLSYEFVSDMLNAILSCKTMRGLHMTGFILDGPAPIKENAHGHLTKKEAIILKLAYILRFSNISVLSVDLDSTLVVQLEELEKTLIKYNTKLTSLISEGIDWKTLKSHSPFVGIAKALKANNWLSQNLSLPKDKQSEISSDLEDLIIAKLNSKLKHDQSEMLFNLESEPYLEAKKLQKKNTSAFYSIESSPKSPRPSVKVKKQYNFPLVFSAETPQFTTSTKGIKFDPEPKGIQDITDMSSIDFDEKRCTPVKMKKERHLEEMWNCLKKLEVNMNSQMEVCSYKISMIEEKTEIALKIANDASENKATDRPRADSDEKAVWSAISRIEKFMSATSKKYYLLDKRLEAAEVDVRDSKDTFTKLLNLIEDQKTHLQENIKEKATKIDLEILDKNSSKISNKLNFLNTEIESFRKDLNRLQHPNRQIEILGQEISRLKEKDLKNSEIFRNFEIFQHEISSQIEKLQKNIQVPKETESVKKERNLNESLMSIGKAQVPILDIPKALHSSSASIEEIKKRISGATDRPKTPATEKFLPGEAESLVLSAIIDKANHSRIMNSLKKSNSRSSTPLLGFKSRIKQIESDSIPSMQLQETLRLRGIPYDSKGAMTERRK